MENFNGVGHKMNKFRIGIAKNQPSANVEKNSEEICHLIRLAKQKGATLIHFPEGGLSGYVKAQIRSWDEVDWEQIYNQLDVVSKEAKANEIWVVIGCNHQLQEPNMPHNSLFIISDQGEIVNRYDKRFCSHSEINGWFTPGNKPCVFDIQGFKFGCALCIEIQFMEVFQEYEKLDVDCILFSAYSNDPMFWIQAQGYAASNNLWISVSTPSSCSEKLPGGLIGPDGNALIRHSSEDSPDIIIAELDKDDARLDIALSKAKPWRRLARSGEIYKDTLTDDERSKNKKCKTPISIK